jgi:hypothetical protein
MGSRCQAQSQATVTGIPQRKVRPAEQTLRPSLFHSLSNLYRIAWLHLASDTAHGTEHPSRACDAGVVSCPTHRTAVGRLG